MGDDLDLLGPSCRPQLDLRHGNRVTRDAAIVAKPSDLLGARIDLETCCSPFLQDSNGMDELDSVTVQPPDRSSVTVGAVNNQLAIDATPHRKYGEVLHGGRLPRVGAFIRYPWKSKESNGAAFA